MIVFRYHIGNIDKLEIFVANQIKTKDVARTDMILSMLTAGRVYVDVDSWTSNIDLDSRPAQPSPGPDLGRGSQSNHIRRC